ncbi:Bifunctional IPC transferase and DIPP synthase [Candidatus Anstonella stagnisolia]|nr:Bifunctional IPC transferase and DIPP synthase [Candidatus Anstonella stagnisolia]
MIKQIPFLRKLQEDAGKAFTFLPLSPTQITMLAPIFALVSLYFMYHRQMEFAIVAFVLSALMDALDGAVARARGQVTKKGGFFDGVCDRFVEFFVLVGLLAYGIGTFILPADVWVLLFVFFGTCMTSFVSAYADHREVMPAKEAADLPAMFHRPERVVCIFLAMLVAPASAVGATAIIGAGAMLSMLTVAQKIVHVMLYKE